MKHDHTIPERRKMPLQFCLTANCDPLVSGEFLQCSNPTRQASSQPSASIAPISNETEPSVAAASMTATSFMAASNPAKTSVSRLLPARFHADFVFELARRSGVILHARCLLLTADFAARLSLRGDIEPTTVDQHQRHYREPSHDTNFSLVCML